MFSLTIVMSLLTVVPKLQVGIPIGLQPGMVGCQLSKKGLFLPYAENSKPKPEIVTNVPPTVGPTVGAIRYPPVLSIDGCTQRLFRIQTQGEVVLLLQTVRWCRALEGILFDPADRGQREESRRSASKGAHVLIRIARGVAIVHQVAPENRGNRHTFFRSAPRRDARDLIRGEEGLPPPLLGEGLCIR
eukprot:3934580-Rhodomonas_salina.2